ncbi:DUF1932 domain-containing protein [Klenkia sp. LSe6-5]|uniref:DUF1932 domain-containing protein n=1 Tax=Klenkia sesuvii TaxID=3103137 RepID=A0ABU8DR32_9ACTN
MSAPRRIAVLHPGRMGAAIGRVLREAGHDVGWLPAGRGEGTRRRAAEAGLTELTDLTDRDVVVSLCPPDAALDTARSVCGFGGLYVDANAVAPATAREIATLVLGGGADVVDGGVVGPPPAAPGTTRLYLSGARAAEAAALFTGTPLGTVVLDGDDVAASSLKMAYAAWTKITAALLVGIDGAARSLGVGEQLQAEWALSHPELVDRLAVARRSVADKGWRWSGEMREVARAFDDLGQPAGFADAAAEVFSRAPRPEDR